MNCYHIYIWNFRYVPLLFISETVLLIIILMILFAEQLDLTYIVGRE